MTSPNLKVSTAAVANKFQAEDQVAGINFFPSKPQSSFGQSDHYVPKRKHTIKAQAKIQTW